MSLARHLPQYENEELIEGCLAGDRLSQYKLYQKFAPAMMGLCLRYASSRHEAADMLQEGFIRVYEKLAYFRGEGSLEGWIRKIMVNTALQHLRVQARTEKPVVLDAAGEISTHPDEVWSRLQSRYLLELVQKLPACARMVFNLYIFEGMKHREIAALLNISEGTSKSNLWDARKRLQQAIAQDLKK